ncbi:hypothetical protein [Streptomyces atratus]|nr:hypothetical protein [Streptomyces atratus]MCX5339721.1 hypothetical protein [Streptomyces atratus]
MVGPAYPTSLISSNAAARIATRLSSLRLRPGRAAVEGVFSIDMLLA